MIRESILVIADIIKNQLNLDDGRIWIYNQDYKMPEDSGLFVVLQLNNSIVYSSTNRFSPAADPSDLSSEELNLLTKEDLTINILSKDSSARLRKEEILFALNSNYAQNKMEEYNFKIANLPNSFLNISELEGAGMLNRFAININVLAWYSKTNTVANYNQFTNSILLN